MKSQGFFHTPQDIMEEYNGCSVPSTLATLCPPIVAKGAHAISTYGSISKV